MTRLENNVKTNSAWVLKRVRNSFFDYNNWWTDMNWWYKAIQCLAASVFRSFRPLSMKSNYGNQDIFESFTNLWFQYIFFSTSEWLVKKWNDFYCVESKENCLNTTWYINIWEISKYKSIKSRIMKSSDFIELKFHCQSTIKSSKSKSDCWQGVSNLYLTALLLKARWCWTNTSSTNQFELRLSV